MAGFKIAMAEFTRIITKHEYPIMRYDKIWKDSGYIWDLCHVAGEMLHIKKPDTFCICAAARGVKTGLGLWEDDMLKAPMAEIIAQGINSDYKEIITAKYGYGYFSVTFVTRK